MLAVDYQRFINDCSTRDNIQKKKIGRFSIINTYRFGTSVKSARSFKTMGGKSSLNVFKKMNFTRLIRLLNYIPKINPLGQFRIIWDIFVGASMLYLFFAISLSVSFSKSLLLYNLPMFISIFILGMLIDMNTGFYEQGIFIQNRKAAALNYLRKYFIFDFISTLALVEQYFSDDLQYFVLFFFLKMQYFRKISKIFKEVLHIKPIFRNIVSFCKLIWVIIFAAHFFACIYIAMVTYLKISPNWVEKQGLNIETQIMRVYIRSFYFSTVTMLTVGYGDVIAQNDAEYSIVTATILIGCMFFGYSLNKIGTIFNELEEQDKKILKNLFIINQYMSRKDIQKDLQFQVREYLTYYWSQNNSTENKASEHIISSLSEGLKQKLQIQATRKVLNQCPIFRQNFTDEFLQKASTLIKEYRSYPDEIITFQGDVDDCSIFFVEQGTAVMYFQGNTNHVGKNDTSIEFKELGKGDTFGFYSFFTGQPRKLTIKSAGFTSLLFIDRAQFLKLIKQYQQDYEIFCTISDNLQTGLMYDQVHSDCYCCQLNDHMITDCPKIHLVIDKIELSKRDMQQTRDNNYLRKEKRKHPILDETNAYHQLFIGAFDNWFDHDDEEDDEDEQDDFQYKKDSKEKLSPFQEKQRRNDSQFSAFDDLLNQSPLKPTLSTQRTKEKRLSLIPPDAAIKQQAIASLIYIPDQKQTKDLNELIVNNINIKQGNFTNMSQKQKAHTSSLTKIRNPSFSQTDDIQLQIFPNHQLVQQSVLQSYQKQASSHSSNQIYLKQNSNQQEKQTSLYTDLHPSLQINVFNNEQEQPISSYLQPQRSKKRSVEKESMTELDRIQQMIQQQSNQMQSAQQQSSQVTTSTIQSNTAYIQLLQQQQQQFQASQSPQFTSKYQTLLLQQMQQQNQIQQQMQQFLQIMQTHQQNQPSQTFQSTNLQQQFKRRETASTQQQPFQSALQNPLSFNFGNQNTQPLEMSNYNKSTSSLININPSEFLKQHSQNSKNKFQQQPQTSSLPEGDKMMLLQKLNNNQPSTQQYEDDCKMKLFTYYFPEWNVNVILQKINLDNGFSVNSSEILSDFRDKKKAALKLKNQDRTISNKRVTSNVYQNANEKKMQEVLSMLNQTGNHAVDENQANDPNSLNLPNIPTYMRDSRKGNTVVIPSIQEQNQQLAALKFTHQSINDKFIVFRKLNPQTPNSKQHGFFTDYLENEHKEKLKSMKRKSITADVDGKMKQRPTANFAIPASSEGQHDSNFHTSTNIPLPPQKALSLSHEQIEKILIQSVDMSENIFENLNEESKITFTHNYELKSSNNIWSSYINQKQ